MAATLPLMRVDAPTAARGLQGGAPKAFGAYVRRCSAATFIFSGCLKEGSK